MDCGDLFRGGKANAKYAESDIAEINSKLDRLMRFLPTDTVIDVSPASGLLPEPPQSSSGVDLRGSALDQSGAQTSHQASS